MKRRIEKWARFPISTLPGVVTFLAAMGLVATESAGAGPIQPSLVHALQDLQTSTTPEPSGLTSSTRSFERADGRWTVSVQLRGTHREQREESATDLLSWGATLSAGLSLESGGRLGSTLELWIDPVHLRELSEREEVLYVGLPHRPLTPAPTPSTTNRAEETLGAEVLTEAFAAIRTGEFWDLGYRGQGVRIGVIDIGFDSYAERIGTELPLRLEARDFTGNGLDGLRDAHGTACAEIIHDLAPESEMYLAAIGTASNLSSAVDWMIENDVDVISHSLAWFLGGGDGTGPIHDIVQRASDAGIVWVTSSGNFRLNHWTGPFRDADGDDWVELSAGERERVALTPITGAGRISLVLLWNRWPDSSDLSFQIDLFDGDTFRMSSEADYADSPFAFREFEFTIGRELVDPNFRIRLLRGSPDSSTQLRVFRTDSRGIDPKDRVTAGSLTMPADGPGVISVGAYSWRNQNIESFSSQGPTLTGRVKPEIIAPDAISTSLQQYSTFVGTSAACPHVTGVTALLMSANIEGGLHELRWSRDEIVRMLQNEADPIAGVAEDQQGAGRVRLILRRPETSPLHLVQRDADGLVLRLDAPLGSTRIRPGPISIHDVAGRRLGQVSGAADRLGTIYRLDRMTLPWSSGRYYARDPETGASVSFYWPGGLQ